MSEFYPVYIYFALVAAVTLGILGVTFLFRMAKPSAAKLAPYESGIQTQTHLLQQRFPLRHYLVALIFLIFDIEVVFLYPWAAAAREIGSFAFFEMLLFFFILLIGFAYVWRKGGLKWE